LKVCPALPEICDLHDAPPAPPTEITGVGLGPWHAGRGSGAQSGQELLRLGAAVAFSGVEAKEFEDGVVCHHRAVHVCVGGLRGDELFHRKNPKNPFRGLEPVTSRHFEVP
jgi:hypothetical protein